MDRQGAASRRTVLLPASFVLLVVLDFARAYVGPSLRPAQWAAGALLLAGLWIWLRGRELRFREALPIVALAAFLLPAWIDHARLLESDGIHYYSYLRSLLFDRDLDLDNDYPLLGWVPQRNVLPIGAPLLWSPLVLLVHLVRQGARLFGLGPPTGAEPIYQAAACLATLAYGSAGVFLLSDTLRRWVSPAAAFWTAVICWVGSPLRFYLSVLPGLAHGGEFFAAVLVLRSYLSLRERLHDRGAAWAGAACGLVFLLRSQDGLLLAVPGLELLLRWIRGPDRPRAARALGVLVLAFAVVALPQVAVWQTMYGQPLLVPHKQIHGENFVLPTPQLAGTLVSERGGLFTTHPALLAGVLGLVVLAFRDPRYVLAVLPVLLAGWYVNSSIFDWYHVRRFTGLVPLLAPGLAALLAPLTQAGVVPMAVLAFFVLRYDQAVDRLRALPGDPAPVQAVVREVAGGLAADGYRLLEAPAPRLAVSLLASYTGEPLPGQEVAVIDLGRQPWILRLPRPARHLSDLAVEDGVACRWVRDREARFFLPWAGRESGVILTVRARALETLEPQVLEVIWNDVSAGRQEMEARWRDYRFHVPPASLRDGTNEVVLRFDRAPIYRRIRSEGPKEVRPAAIATLTIHRGS